MIVKTYTPTRQASGYERTITMRHRFPSARCVTSPRPIHRTRSCCSTRPVLEILESRVLLSDFYDLAVIAQTGVAGLTSIGNGPSINDLGEVAFIGHAGPDEGIYVGAGDGSTRRNINPLFSHDPDPQFDRHFGPAVQINNAGRVVADESVSYYGSPPAYYTFLRSWDSNATDSWQMLIKAGNFSSVVPTTDVCHQQGYSDVSIQLYLDCLQAAASNAVPILPRRNPLDLLLPFPSMNNNGDVVFYGAVTRDVLHQTGADEFKVAYHGAEDHVNDFT